MGHQPRALRAMQVTAGDASDPPAPRVSASLLKLATGKPDRAANRPRSLLHKLAHAPLPSNPLLGGLRSSTAEEGGADGDGTAPSSARSSRAGEEDAEELGGELEEGQLLRFTIALSQVASIERHERRIKARPGSAGRVSCACSAGCVNLAQAWQGIKAGKGWPSGVHCQLSDAGVHNSAQLCCGGNAVMEISIRGNHTRCPDGVRLQIFFQRQKPHRSTESSDDWKAVMKVGAGGGGGRWRGVSTR